MAGELLVLEDGYVGIAGFGMSDGKGKGLVLPEDVDDCPCCSDCDYHKTKYMVLHAWTSSRDYGPEDLTPYKKEGRYFKYWRLAEGTITWRNDGCWEGITGSRYGSGSIVKGELIGLPDNWTSNYSYTGAMKLFVYCC
jgi:hypothetical protein